MWGSAFAVCITQSSLTCQFEHSGKVCSGLIGNFYFHCYQVRPHFLCAALMSSQRTKQHALRRLSNIIVIKLGVALGIMISSRHRGHLAFDCMRDAFSFGSRVRFSMHCLH